VIRVHPDDESVTVKSLDTVVVLVRRVLTMSHGIALNLPFFSLQILLLVDARDRHWYSQIVTSFRRQIPLDRYLFRDKYNSYPIVVQLSDDLLYK